MMIVLQVIFIITRIEVNGTSEYCLPQGPAFIHSCKYIGRHALMNSDCLSELFIV